MKTAKEWAEKLYDTANAYHAMHAKPALEEYVGKIQKDAAGFTVEDMREAYEAGVVSSDARGFQMEVFDEWLERRKKKKEG